MSAPTTAAEGVVAKASRRAASSEDPPRFEDLVTAYVDDVVRGRPTVAPPRLDEDDVLTAAYIEATAGIRRLRAQAHPLSCRCDGCRTHLYVTAHRRYDQ
ncbi:hypothetical protein B0E38_04727 [Streptomyces sp. 111WW2]|uniref:hypothetical protein n=1 Tax=Streptomyces sp. 111WW2 TaxID=1945515 RepID=UPI000D0C78D0|nr:hypothetical protein [Streptomyces sp. 111WW2]PSK52401.1 hypothetical protein B0E38_04727 [Streptomyces sp. 111WW2]